jgi:hypothetical protein
MNFRIFPGIAVRRNRCVLRLERLEDRSLPAVTLSPVSNGILTLKGDNRPNMIRIQDDATGLTITGDGVTNVFPPGQDSPTTIVIKTLSGRDTVEYDSNSTPSSGTRIVNVMLGKGNDLVSANINGGLSGTAGLQVNVQGSRGKATFRSFIQGDLTGSSSLQLSFTGGRGAAGYFVQSTAQLLDSASLILNALGGAGRNNFAANLDGAIAAGASVSVNLNGGAERDTIFTTYRGMLDGTLTVHQDGSAGNDVVSSFVTARNGSRGQAAVAETGGPGNDRMTLEAREQGSAGTLHVTATMDGGLGQDFGRVTSNVVVENIELPLLGGQVVAKR